MSTIQVKQVGGVEYTRPSLENFQSPEGFLLAMLKFVLLDTSARELNRRAGCKTSPTTVQQYVNGVRKVGSAAMAEAICRGLELTPEETAVVERFAFEQYKRRLMATWFTKTLDGNLPAKKLNGLEAA